MLEVVSITRRCRVASTWHPKRNRRNPRLFAEPYAPGVYAGPNQCRLGRRLISIRPAPASSRPAATPTGAATLLPVAASEPPEDDCPAGTRVSGADVRLVLSGRNDWLVLVGTAELDDGAVEVVAVVLGAVEVDAVVLGAVEVEAELLGDAEEHVVVGKNWPRV